MTGGRARARPGGKETVATGSCGRLASAKQEAPCALATRHRLHTGTGVASEEEIVRNVLPRVLPLALRHLNDRALLAQLLHDLLAADEVREHILLALRCRGGHGRAPAPAGGKRVREPEVAVLKALVAPGGRAGGERLGETGLHGDLGLPRGGVGCGQKSSTR